MGQGAFFSKVIFFLGGALGLGLGPALISLVLTKGSWLGTWQQKTCWEDLWILGRLESIESSKLLS